MNKSDYDQLSDLYKTTINESSCNTKRESEDDTDGKGYKCDHCDGKGYHADGSPCQKCDGDGIIEYPLNAAHCNEDDQSDAHKDIEDLKKLHDNPDEEFATKNYGSVEAYKKMLKRKIEGLTSKLEGTYLESEQRPKDEEDAEKVVGTGPDDCECDEPVEAEEKNTEKKVNEGINNQKKVKVMTEDKSIFDKLFEQVMGEADEEAMELGIDIPGDEAGDEDAGFDAELTGDEVTITLKPEHVELLKDILAQVDGEEEEAGEEEGGEEDEAGEEAGDVEFGQGEEAIEEETHATTDGKVTGVDPSNGGGGTSELPADALGGKSSGEGDSKVTDEEGTKATKDGAKPGHDPSGLTADSKKVVKK